MSLAGWTPRTGAVRSVEGMIERRRAHLSEWLAWFGFLTGFAAFALSWEVFFEYRLLKWDENEFCQMLIDVRLVEFVGAPFAPQATCVWPGGALELVPRAEIVPTALLWLLSTLLFVAAIGVSKVGPFFSNAASLIAIPLMFLSALFTWTTGYAVLGPIAVFEEPAPAPPREPTSEELDGWSFVLPRPASVASVTWDDAYAETVELSNATLLAAGPIPHPWDPDTEPTWPINAYACSGGEYPLFEADFDTDVAASAMGRVRELWQSQGFTIARASTANHIVATDATPVTGAVLSIQRYGEKLRILVNGPCGSR